MLIGITGKAGAGKDTVAGILKDEYGFACISFAFPIKNAIALMVGVPYSTWEDREWKEATLPIWNQSPRYLAQRLGTEWGRLQIHDQIWVDLALHQAKMANKEGYPNVCITDVRFRNEADAIRAPGIGGRIIHVLRDSSDLSHGLRAHASESGIGTPNTSDLFLDNNGTIERLGSEVKKVMESIVAEGVNETL